LIDNEKTAYLRFLLTKGIGSGTILKLLKNCENLLSALELTDEELNINYKIKQDSLDELRNNQKKVENELKLIKQKELSLISIKDEFYPKYLSKIKNPPCLLYVYGNLKALNQDCIAIVGSRNASYYAKESAQKFASGFAKAGVVVVSGFAMGVDSFAHEGAVKVEGRTIAVLGNGFCFLKDGLCLIKDIIKNNGAIISEFIMNTRPSVGTFPKRNRIISGISNKGVIVIEAGMNSGALITAKYAKQHNRKVYVVPGNIFSPYTEGSNELLKKGAIFIDRVSDVLGKENNDKKQEQIEHILDKQEKIVFEILDNESVSMEALTIPAFKKGLTLQTLISILIKLEIKGFVKQFPGKRFAKKI
jgi:DNA processing protein